MSGSSGGAPIDRVWQALRSRAIRLQPARLAWIASGAAALAVALFAILPSLGGPAIVESGQTVPPTWAGQATLDREGVYDSDADGLADSLENQVYGTDPTTRDSGGSGLPDGWLVRHGFDPLDPAIADRPAARPPPEALPPAYRGAWPARFVATLRDVYEHGRPSTWNETTQGPFDSKLDPRTWDSNGDGLPDGWLLHHGFDPLDEALGDARPAGPDGLTVREAFQHAADPRSLDGDSDGLADRDEVAGPTNPTPQGPRRFPPTDPSRTDTAGAGVCDGYLVAHGLDPTQAALALGDPDRDGATTREEFVWSQARFGARACAEGAGLDPVRQVSGTSTIPDGWLIRHGLDPLDAAVDARVTQSSGTDPGPTEVAAGGPEVELTVLREYRANRPHDWVEATSGPWWGGTNPALNDTDGDGLGDAWELRGFMIGVATEPGQQETAPHRASSDPTRPDTDGDGLPDGQEADPTLRDEDAGGATDPQRWDTDFDGIDDGGEVALGFGLDPARADTAGDFLRDGDRLEMLERRATTYATNSAYEYPGEPGKERDATEWAALLPGAANLPRPLHGSDLAALLGPRGDADGKGDLNILDKDIDEDGLLNGWEMRPQSYAGTEFGVGEFAAGRPATDPLNPDTDGDLLRDGWEMLHGVPDHKVSRYSLDPSRWNSDEEVEPDDAKESDAAEDPDGDGVLWVAFNGETAVPNGGTFTNLEEQSYEGQGADPNRFDSDGDGLADGWKVFWSLVYPGLGPQSTPSAGTVYPGDPPHGPLAIPAGAPVPSLGSNQSEVAVHQASYTRFVVDPSDLLPGEKALPQGTELEEPGGGTRTVYRVDGLVTLRFVDVQNARANPYLEDTDGDQMPDWWELLHSAPLPGMVKTDGTPVGDCVSGSGPSPVVRDATLDTDGDGLDNLAEHEHGTDPLCRDSDAGGIRDGEESGFGLDPATPSDDQTLLKDKTDSDGDGLLDFEEVTGIVSVDYGYLGPSVRTRHDTPDSDGDGLLDGATRPSPATTPQGWLFSNPMTQRFLDLGIAYFTSASGGFFFMGEKASGTDPREGDDSGTGIPAGWLAAHRISFGVANSQHAELYRIAMPAWWRQELHGPWWGGGEPGQDLAFLRVDIDLDNDGLRDRDGDDGYEDPWPAANLPNEPRPVEYAAHGLPVPTGPLDEEAGAMARRMAAQAFLHDRTVGPTHYSYPRDPNTRETTERLQPCIEIDAAPPLVLFKGGHAALTGRVAGCGNGPPFAGVTVEARLGNPPAVVGANFTAPDGRFRLDVRLVAEHELQMPAAAIVFRGNTSGTVRWSANLAAIPPGDGNSLVVRSYATPAGATYQGRIAPLKAAVESLPVTVKATTTLAVDAPAAAATGKDLPVSIRLADGAGTPLQQAAVQVTLEGGETRVATTGADGTAEVTLPAPHALAGKRNVTARFVPAGNLAGFVDPAEGQDDLLLQRPGSLRLDPPGTADAGKDMVVRGRLAVPAGSPGGVGLRLRLTSAGQTLATVDGATEGDGRFALRLLVPANAAAGPHLLTVASAPGGATLASQAQEVLEVRSIPRFTAVQNGTLAVGKPVAVSGLLVEPDGSRPLAHAVVTVQVEGLEAQATTDADGRFAVELNGLLPVRPALQRLAFAGDATHQPAEHRTGRFVASATRIEMADGAVGRGHEARVAARLVDAQGFPVGHVPLTLQWGEEEPQAFLTDTEGGATLARRGAPGEALGEVVVRGSFAGSPSAGLAASTARASWTIRSGAEILLPNGTFEIGAPVPAGLLRDSGDHAPLPRRTLTLQSGGEAWTVTTDERGRFDALPAGPHFPGRLLLAATFDGGDSHGPASNTSAVDRRTPVILAIRAPAALVAGREVVLAAFVLDAGQRPVGEGEVVARIGADLLGRWPVAAGLARMNLTLRPDHPPGAAEVLVEYLGDGIHAPAAARVGVSILAAVDLHIQAERASAGGIAVVRVTALAAGRPLPFTPLSLAVGGTGSGLVATTNEDGVATFLLEQDGSAVPLAARYAGDAMAGPAMASLLLEPASPLSVVGRHGGPIAFLVLGLGAVLGAIALVAARLRKQPLEEAFRRIHHLLEARGLTEQTILASYRILEDVAIAKALLLGRAATPRTLEESLRPALPAAAHASLGRFIGLFEEARYGSARMGEPQRFAALRALQDLMGSLAAERPVTLAGRPA